MILAEEIGITSSDPWREHFSKLTSADAPLFSVRRGAISDLPAPDAL